MDERSTTSVCHDGRRHRGPTWEGRDRPTGVVSPLVLLIWTFPPCARGLVFASCQWADHAIEKDMCLLPLPSSPQISVLPLPTTLSSFSTRESMPVALFDPLSLGRDVCRCSVWVPCRPRPSVQRSRLAKPRSTELVSCHPLVDDSGRRPCEGYPRGSPPRVASALQQTTWLRGRGR